MRWDWDVDRTAIDSSAHLGLRLRTPEAGFGLRAEAEISLNLFFGSFETDPRVRDNASYLRLAWRPGNWGEQESLALTVLPLASTRLHLGYESPATWGRRIFAGLPLKAAPGFEVRLTRERWYAFAAVKSDLALNCSTNANERLMMFIAGAGMDVLPALRIELAGMRADEGVIPGSEDELKALRSNTIGASGRVLFRHGEPIAPSVDLSRYWSDPAVFESLFAPETYSDGFAASLSLEASHLVLTLRDPNTIVFATQSDGADVAAIQSRIKVGRWRANLLGVYRSPIFAAAEALGRPGFSFPYRAITKGSETRADLLLSGGVDYSLARAGLTPGLIVFAERPASVTSPEVRVAVSPWPDAELERRRFTTVLTRDGQLRDISPFDVAVGAKATLRCDFGEAVSLLGEVSWTRDPHRVTLNDRTFLLPGAEQIGFAAMLQGRL